MLGLSHDKLKASMDSDTFLCDVIAGRLRKEDFVNKKGEPSWTTLVNALRIPQLNKKELPTKLNWKKYSDIYSCMTI